MRIIAQRPESFNLIEFSTNIFLASASLSKARDMVLKEKTNKNVKKTDITIFINLSYHQPRGMLRININLDLILIQYVPLLPFWTKNIYN